MYCYLLEKKKKIKHVRREVKNQKIVFFFNLLKIKNR